jgi:hypothetical protein
MLGKHAQIVPTGSSPNDHSAYSHDSEGTDQKMEEILVNAAEIAEKTLLENIDVFRQLTNFIEEEKKVNAKQIKAFYDSIGFECQILGKNSVIKSGIEDTYNKFLAGELEVVGSKERMVAEMSVEAETEKI